MKVMTRLQNITYLQTLLERALAGEVLIYQNLDSPNLMQCGTNSSRF